MRPSRSDAFVSMIADAEKALVAIENVIAIAKNDSELVPIAYPARVAAAYLMEVTQRLKEIQ